MLDGADPELAPAAGTAAGALASLDFDSVFASDFDSVLESFAVSADASVDLAPPFPA